ncbi:hypothetical protein KGA66_11310 [Actinocrinis puniceicyclus]|uniref:Uncharacterized protein n=1 Tax=Actinocrinis puniceicyclus TaxID=977794 RepID=A0A8J8BEC7_9ACTN|nr:hypothetical protein [Actinocrinis puniceicyclus]MBS2963639.1 hypothetical protein [Actinocrinis puniceicyclus]
MNLDIARLKAAEVPLDSGRRPSPGETPGLGAGFPGAEAGAAVGTAL